MISKNADAVLRDTLVTGDDFTQRDIHPRKQFGVFCGNRLEMD